MEEIDNKERIVKGAEELFTRYGIRSVSMDDIARLEILRNSRVVHVHEPTATSRKAAGEWT